MGAWGSGLYSNDDAADFLELVHPILKLPQPINELIELLRLESADEIGDETTFWLVLADQLEKKGVRHPSTANKAIEILEAGTDIEELRDAGAEEIDVKARAKANLKLLARLKNPRAEKPRKTLKKPQPAAVKVGDYVCFPTQQGSAPNPYSPPGTEDFVQDGWGLIQVHDIGWEFEYLNWVKILQLTWSHKHPPTIEDAIRAPAQPYVCLAYGTLSSAHFKRMQMQVVGNQEPRSDAPAPRPYHRTAHFSAINDISICNFLHECQ